MSPLKIILMVAVLSSLPQVFSIIDRISSVDPIVYERLKTEKKILRAMNDELSSRMKDIESRSGISAKKWCGGSRYTPEDIKVEIANGHIDQAYDNLTQSFTRTEAISRSLTDPLFLMATPQNKLDALLALAKNCVVPEKDVISVLEPYVCALERVHATRRIEDFQTELMFLAKYQKANPTTIAGIADSSPQTQAAPSTSSHSR